MEGRDGEERAGEWGGFRGVGEWGSESGGGGDDDRARVSRRGGGEAAAAPVRRPGWNVPRPGLNAPLAPA